MTKCFASEKIIKTLLACPTDRGEVKKIMLMKKKMAKNISLNDPVQQKFISDSKGCYALEGWGDSQGKGLVVFVWQLENTFKQQHRFCSPQPPHKHEVKSVRGGC